MIHSPKLPFPLSIHPSVLHRKEMIVTETKINCHHYFRSYPKTQHRLIKYTLSTYHWDEVCFYCSFECEKKDENENRRWWDRKGCRDSKQHHILHWRWLSVIAFISASNSNFDGKLCDSVRILIFLLCVMPVTNSTPVDFTHTRNTVITINHRFISRQILWITKYQNYEKSKSFELVFLELLCLF